jgi:predicted dehydrogenase
MKVGVVGLGYWGPNLVRNFLSNKEVKKVYGCDQNLSRLQFINSRFPEVQLTDKWEEFLNGYDLDIIAIATPVATHYPLAKAALENGKHIWVEKPFTFKSEEAEELINIAERKNLKIFVDHTFIYTGAVRKIKEIIERGDLGNILYYDSVRVNLGLFQNDVNVIWDLAAHDLSILDFLLKKKVTEIAAHGIANYYNHENIAHINIYFEDNCFAHFHVNWTSPVKIRRVLIGGTKKMLVFDDLEYSEKIKIYDSGVSIDSKEGVYNALIQYRIGDMYSPRIDQTEALSLGVAEFISAINENRQPLTNGYDGLRIVKLLEAADYSIKNKGKLIQINQE